MASVPATTHDLSAGAQAGRGAASWLAAWLWTVAALVIVMVLVGGATRLTGSGLSITEWKPVSGALPPLSDADWAAEFARYQASPQYQLLNSGMDLAAFKSIFWWEWAHRQLGRFIGLVYAGGFVYGLATRAFPARTGLRLAGLGLLLGVQGLIGWIMVASGLKPGMTAVEPVNLAAHLFAASLFLAGLVTLATSLEPGPAFEAEPRDARPSRLADRVAKLLLALILVQIALGGLVAGSHAGLVYNSWPTMDGRFVPPLAELFAASPWWENLVANLTLIQLDHRLVAYLVLGLALWNAALWAKRPASGRLALVLAALVVAQAALGVATLLLAVPLHAALAHQFLAVLVLVVAARLAAIASRLARPSAASEDAATDGPLATLVATR